MLFRYNMVHTFDLRHCRILKPKFSMSPFSFLRSLDLYMKSSKRFLVITVALFSLACHISGQYGGEMADRFCTGSNITINSTYQSNLKKLLSSFASRSDSSYGPYGFYNFSEGLGADKVYGIALCRADLTRLRCQSCLLTASADLNVTCSAQKEEGIVYFEYCTMRYSNRYIFSQLEESPSKEQNLDTEEEKNLRKFVSPLLDKLRDQAVLGNSTQKFAFGYDTSANLGMVYAFVQCTPDLTGELCGQCLNSMINVARTSPTPSLGSKVLCPSCQVRYEAYRFYENSVQQLQPLLPPTDYVPPKGQRSTRTRNIVVSVVAAVCLLILTAWIYFYLRRRTQEKIQGTEEMESRECLQYDFETIRAAAHNFSDDSKLGQGGFGAVYKGRLSDGQEIAVKRLAMNSGQGDLEFKNEVMLVAELQHRNLVKLLGFCLEGRERLLVFEFVPNASLDHFIFAPTKSSVLNWDIRYKIIVGIAKGLLYLHEDSRLRIIHRDLKAGNVLLDEEMNAKIADFGLAKLFLSDQTQHETKRVVGTYGYMAPEYALDGHFSTKSDVYSFGVLVLEIVTGQRNSTFGGQDGLEYLISYAWKCWKAGTSEALIDPALTDDLIDEIMRCVHIALLCVQDSATMRPTMASVVPMLTSLSLPLPNPSEPAYYIHSSKGSDQTQSSGLSKINSSASEEPSYNVLANDYSDTLVYPR